MREDEIRLRIGGEVTLDLLSAALAQFTRALEAAEASHGASIRWVLTGLDHGSATALARAIPNDGRSEALAPQVCLSLVETGRAVMEGKADEAVPMTRHLAKLLNLASHDQPVVIDCVGAAVEFAPVEAVELSRADDDVRATLGTIRGRIEMLSQRRGLHFSLYDLAVSCFPAKEMESTMRDAWGQVADVTGTVKRDPATDRPRSIRDITSVEFVDEGDDLGYRALRGVLETREPAEVLVRRMRDAE